MRLKRYDFFPAARRAPESYQRILSRYGKNLYGENLLRLIWLPSRCYIAGGWWEVEKAFGYRRVAKYALKEEKWAIEKWCSPSKYGNPKLWEQQTLSPEGFLQVGTFPAHGEFECAAVFSTGRGPKGYVPLEPGTVDLQARLIFNSRTLSVWDIRQSLKAEEVERERKQDDDFETLWQGIQHTHSGLTFGSGGNYDPQADIAAKRNELLANRDLWLSQDEFQSGFLQEE